MSVVRDSHAKAMRIASGISVARAKGDHKRELRLASEAFDAEATAAREAIKLDIPTEIKVVLICSAYGLARRARRYRDGRELVFSVFEHADINAHRATILDFADIHPSGAICAGVDQ